MPLKYKVFIFKFWILSENSYASDILQVLVIVLHNRHFRKKYDELYTMQGLKLDYMGCAKIIFIP